MPKGGVVRAAERVAFWHEAAEDEWEQQLLPQPEPAPISGSPAGAEPPAISKSKKFLQPAKQLKTQLDSMPHPDTGDTIGLPQHAHGGLEDFFAAKPNFTKTYVKPQYQDMLKAHLGDDNYAKMLYHMPAEHHQQLTQQTQSPAPNSKKWSVPANQLKKILDDPHTETSQVTDWLQGPGAAFAKSYLKPGYDDALKSHLGEQKYHELQQHLQAPSQPEVQQPKKLVDKLNEADPEGQYSEHGGWNWDTPEGQKTLQNMIKEHQEYGEDETAAQLQQVHDEHFGQPGPQGLGDKLKAVYPGLPASLQKAYNSDDDFGKQQLPGWIENLTAGGKGDVAQALQEIHDEHFGQPAQAERPIANPFTELLKNQPYPFTETLQNPAPAQSHEPSAGLLANEISKIFPGAPTNNMTTPQLKTQLEQWLKYLPDHEGYAAHVPQLQQLYDQHFGDGAVQQPKPGAGMPFFDEYDKLHEQEQQQGPPQHHKDHAQILDAYGEPSEDFKQWLADADGYQWGKNPGHDKVTLSKLVNPDDKWTQKKVQGYLKHQQELDEAWGQNPSDEDHLQAIQDLLQPVHQQQQTPPQVDLHSLAEEYGAIFGSEADGTGLANHLDDPEDAKKYLLSMMKDWEGDKEGPQIKELYDQYFGEGAQQSPAGVNTDALAEGIHAINPSFMLNKLKASKPEDLKAVLESQANAHKGTPKGDQYQQLLDQHFGGGGGADEHQQNLSTMAHYLDQQGWDTTGHAYQKWLGNLSPQQVAFFAQYPEEAHAAFDDYVPSENKQVDYQLPQFGGSAPPPGSASGGTSTDSHQQNLDTIAKAMGPPSSPEYQRWQESLVPDLASELAQNPAAAWKDYEAWKKGFPDDQSGPSFGPAPFDSYAIAKGVQAADPHTFDDQWVADTAKNSTPEQWKSWLQSSIDADYSPEETAQYQKVYDKYFGDLAAKWQKVHDQMYGGEGVSPVDPNAYPGASFAAMSSKEIGMLPSGFYENYYSSGKKGDLKFDPGVAAFLESQGYGPDELKQLGIQGQGDLMKAWKALPQEGKEQFAAQEQEGQQAGGTPGTAPQTGPTSQDVFNAFGASYTGTAWYASHPDKASPEGGGDGDWENWSPQEQKEILQKYLDDSHVDASAKDKLQDLLDKYFGSDGQQQAPGSGTAPQPQDIIDWMGQQHDWGPTAPGFGALKNMSDPAQMAAQLESMKENFSDSASGTEAKQELQNAIDHFFGAQQSASPAKPYSSTAAWSDWKKIYPSSKAKSTFADPVKAKAWIEHKLSLKSTTTAAAAKKQQIKQFYDKHFGDAGQSGSSGIDINTTKPDKAGLEKFFDTLWPTLQGVKENWVNNQLGSSTWNSTYFKEHYPQEWAQAEKYFGQGGQSQPVKPDFDWKAFGPEWMALSPNSSWGKSTHSEADTEAKLKDAVESANASYPGTEKTKALGELYQKWFPGGATPGQAAPVYEPPPPPASEGYKNLTNRAEALKHLFSDKDRQTLKSPEFRNWFDAAPAKYRSYVEDSPGVALDDYEGGHGYSSVPADFSTKAPKAPQANPFTQKMPSGTPKALQYNKPRSNQVDFPVKADEQETLPGVKWGPNYEKLPIYRVLNLDLNHTPSADRAPAYIQAQGPKATKLWAQQQTSRLRRIDQILNGDKAGRDPEAELQQLKSWGSQYGLSGKEVNDLAGVLFGQQGDLFGDDPKWQHIKGLGQKHPDIPIDELHDLAAKMDVVPPAGSRGNYDHPELGQLILDYLENTSHRGDDDGENSSSEGGLGWHWTRAVNKIYKGIPSASQGKSKMRATDRQVPVAISGLWGGQGEGGGHGSAFEPHSKDELEHNLHSHAPVEVRRVQIRAPSQENQGYGTWHDVIDHGPISLWGQGRYEEGDEGYRSDTSPGEMVKFKPSLAEELNKTVSGYHDPETFDKLTPGHKADMTFTHLLHEHPEQKDQLLKLYEMFFVGRPDLPTKPHTRRASLQHQAANPHDLDPRNPAHLAALAQSWGIAHPERYGLPQGLGERPVQRENLAALEDQITRLAANHLPDPEWMAQHFPGGEYDTSDKIAELYQDNPHSWVFQQYDQDNPDDDDEQDDSDYDDYEPESDDDDDYEYSNDDFEDPPVPTMDRPKGWPQQAPWLKNDPRDRQYFPPHGLNAPSSSSARPDIDWEDEEHEQDPLPFRHDFLPGREPQPGGQHQLFDVGVGNEGYEWPKGVQPTPMYRGLMVDLNHKDLAPLRRSLLGGEYENDSWYKNNAQPHPQGYNNSALGEHLLNHIENNPKSYEGHSNYGLGPHWSLNEGTARDFAQQTTLGSQGHPLKLPTVVRSQWKGLGEDPYRTNTQGDWPEEGEVTMLPGTQMHIDSVKIQHPKTKVWHEVLGQPQQRHASMGDELEVFPQVALRNRRSWPSTNPRQIASKVEVRRPRGVLTHAERRL